MDRELGPPVLPGKDNTGFFPVQSLSSSSVFEQKGRNTTKEEL